MGERSVGVPFAAFEVSSTCPFFPVRWQALGQGLCQLLLDTFTIPVIVCTLGISYNFKMCKCLAPWVLNFPIWMQAANSGTKDPKEKPPRVLPMAEPAVH